MIIAVIGQQKSDTDLDYQPWDIKRLEGGMTRVFGLTPGKTTIQQANQIFACFAETRLYSRTRPQNEDLLELIAVYDELKIDGSIAEIRLIYSLNQKELQDLYDSTDESKSTLDKMLQQHYRKVDKQSEMSQLNTAIKQVIYTPSIDYGEDIIRQRFGAPENEEVIRKENSDKSDRVLHYPSKGLSIFINHDAVDHFVYSAPK